MNPPNIVFVCINRSYNQNATEEQVKKATCEEWKIAESRIPYLQYIVGYISNKGVLTPVSAYKINHYENVDGGRIKFPDAKLVDLNEFYSLSKKCPQMSKSRNPVFYGNI